MRKLMALGLSTVVAISGFGFAFADQSVPIKTVLRDVKPGVLKEAKEAKEANVGAQNKVKDKDAVQAAFRTKITEATAQYAPEMQGDFETVWASHDAIHLSLEALKAQAQTAHKAEMQGMLEGFKAAVLAGEMTKAEVKTQMDALRAQHQAERDGIRAAVDALKADFGLGDGVGKGVHDRFKAALATGDSAQIQTALSEVLAHIQKHVAFDQAKYTLLEAQL